MRVLHWDQTVRGLALSIQPTGRRSWRFTYRAGGRLRIYTLADADRLGLAEARRAAAILAGKVAGGEDPQAEKLRERRADTFAEVTERYFDHAKIVNKSWKQFDFLAEKYLLPKWGKLRARNIIRGDVRTLMRKITNDGTPVLANQVLATASAIFSWCLKEEIGDLVTNPCVGVTRNPTKSRERILSDIELVRFWAAFDDAGLVRGTALKVLLLSGQRPGEVACMRREHITDGWWELPGEPDPKLMWPGTKNGQSHRVWLSDPVRQLVAEVGGGSTGFAFPGNDRGTGPVLDLDRTMRDVCATLGIVAPDKITPHDLRRTHGTMIAALGFGRDAMNRIQNHREGRIGSVYDRHNYASEHMKIQEAVTRKVLALLKGDTAGNVVVLKAG